MNLVLSSQDTMEMELVLADALKLMNVLLIHITVQMKLHVRTQKVDLLVSVKLDSVEMDSNARVGKHICAWKFHINSLYREWDLLSPLALVQVLLS